MRLFVVVLLPLTTAFTVLPYVQIDFAHYFRLAQCQAKCSEKYGVPSKRTLNDGFIEEYFDVHGEEARYCETGCHQHRRAHVNRKQQRSLKGAVEDGTRFWTESKADSASTGTTPLSSVELLCQSPAAAETEFEDSIEGLVGLRMRRPAGAARYVVQWKQRTFALGFYDETQWITASIEHSTLFRAEGMVPGVQYRFLVTVVGPNGKLGSPLMSEWAEAAAAVKAPAGPMTVRNGFSAELGVTGQVMWSRSPFDSCQQRIFLSNHTHQITRDISLDQSASVLLPHLEFDQVYQLSVSALSGKDGESKPLRHEFRSVKCNDVHGPGSLNCAPQPVSDLKIVVRPNATALVSWSPSADIEYTLTYQLFYQSITDSPDCRVPATNVYLSAATTQTEIELASGDCEYLIRVINYDLIGRDAHVETRARFERLSSPLLQHLDVYIICAAVVALLCLFLLIRCHVASRVSEDKQKSQEKLVAMC